MENKTKQRSLNSDDTSSTEHIYAGMCPTAKYPARWDRMCPQCCKEKARIEALFRAYTLLITISRKAG